MKLFILFGTLLILMLVPGTAASAHHNDNCAKKYSRAQFHRVARQVYDGQHKATADGKKTLHRVVHCQRRHESIRIVAFHIERYRHHHNVEMHERMLAQMGPRGYAQYRLSIHGWASEWSCLDTLVYHESGWDPYASNPSSGAYGLGQALPGSKMSVAGSDWETNFRTQLIWMIDYYIADRYGSPCNAWAFWQGHSWY